MSGTALVMIVACAVPVVKTIGGANVTVWVALGCVSLSEPKHISRLFTYSKAE